MNNVKDMQAHKTKEIEQWLDSCKNDILSAQSVALVIKTKDGDYLSGYYKCDIREKNAMAKEIEFDAIDAFIYNNIGRYVERV